MNYKKNQYDADIHRGFRIWDCRLRNPLIINTFRNPQSQIRNPLCILKNIMELEQEVAHQKMQLSIDSINMSFGELINLYKNKELIIRPEHQRFFRWTAKQKTALIESMLLSITLPPVFVAEDENGIWELIDGLQIVTTFLSCWHK